MFANENWKHARLYGSNAWAGIAELALQLADVFQNKDGLSAQKVATELEEVKK